MRQEFLIFSAVAVLLCVALGMVLQQFFWVLLPLLGLIGVGIYDMVQKKHTIWRNFPLVGRGRMLVEILRPPFQQYFIESETDELLAAAGLERAEQLNRSHINRRVNATTTQRYDEIFPYLAVGSLLQEPFPLEFAHFIAEASEKCFSPDHCIVSFGDSMGEVQDE